MEQKRSFHNGENARALQKRGLKDIVIFNKVVAEAKGQNLLYKERSKGEFKILSHSPEVRAIFEKIKVAIKKKFRKREGLKCFKKR